METVEQSIATMKDMLPHLDTICFKMTEYKNIEMLVMQVIFHLPWRFFEQTH